MIRAIVNRAADARSPQNPATVAEIEPAVIEADETLDTDQLGRQMLMHVRDDIFRIRNLPDNVRSGQLSESFKQVAFGRCAHQGRRDSLAHNIADKHVEAVLTAGQKVEEVAIHGARRHCQHADLDARAAQPAADPAGAFPEFLPNLNFLRSLSSATEMR